MTCEHSVNEFERLWSELRALGRAALALKHVEGCEHLAREMHDRAVCIAERMHDIADQYNHNC